MVSRTEEFLKLELGEVKKFLNMDEIIVKSEESIFECVLRWIEVLFGQLALQRIKPFFTGRS